MKKILLILIISIYGLKTTSLHAKKIIKCKKEMKKADDHIKEDQLQEASIILQEIIEKTTEKSLAISANYKLALSEYYQGKREVARKLFLDLLDEEDNDENIFYIFTYLALISAEEHNYLDALKKIKQALTKKKIENQDKNLFERIIKKFENKIDLLGELMDLLKENEELVEIVWNEINAIPLEKRNFVVFNSLAEKFSKIPSEYKFFKNRKTIYKDQYSIVVFHSIENDEGLENSFSRGIDFANYIYENSDEEVLKNKFSIHYIKINDSENLQKIIDSLENQPIDCIIFLGDKIFLKEINIFSEKRKIPLIDFVSVDISAIGNNPHHFFVNTSFDRITSLAINFFRNENLQNEKIVIINSEKDLSVIKNDFVNRLKKWDKCDFKIIQIDNAKASAIMNNFLKFQKKLIEETSEDIQNLAEANYVVFLINDNFATTTVINTLSGLRNYKAKIIFLADIFEEFIDIDNLIKFNSFFIVNEIINTTSAQIKDLEQKFSKRYNQNIFNKSAIIGYLITKFIIEAMVKEGTNFLIAFFDNEINLSDIGKLKYGYCKDNQAIKILKLDKNSYEPLNLER